MFLFTAAKIVFILLGLFFLALLFLRGGRGSPPDERAARKTAFLVMSVLGYLFFRGIGDHGLLDPIEGINASVALNMAMRSDFTVPVAEGHVYAGSSLGFWWLSALSLSLFGWSEFSVRLWSVIGGLGITAAGWFIALRAGGARAANYTAVLIGSSLLVFAASQLSSPHALYAFCVTMSLLGAVYGLRQRRFFILLHASAVLAFVVYGPSGFLLPWLALLVYAVTAEQERFFAGALFYWPGLLLTVLAGGGYFLFLKAKNPYILTLMLRNIPGDAFNSFSWALVFLLLGFLPWLGALPGALKSAFPFKWGVVLPSEKQNALFLAWSAVFLFFGAFSRDAMLLAAALPAIGAICGDYLAQAVEKQDFSILRKFVAMEILVLVPLLFVGLPWFFLTGGRPFRYTLMSVIPWAVFCLLFLLAGWRCARRRKPRKLMLYMCAFSMFSLLPLAGVFDLLGGNLSVRDAGIYIRNAAKREDLLVQYALNHPSLAFYAGKTDMALAHAAPNRKIAGQTPVDEAYLERIWTGKQRVFLLIERHQKVESPLPRVVYNIFEARDKIVLSNQSDSEPAALDTFP